MDLNDAHEIANYPLVKKYIIIVGIPVIILILFTIRFLYNSQNIQPNKAPSFVEPLEPPIVRAPVVTLNIDKTAADVGEPFVVTLNGESQVGLKSVWWFVRNENVINITGTIDGEEHEFSAKAKDVKTCDGKKSCTYSRTVIIDQPGFYTILANARDSKYGAGTGGAHQASEGSGIPSVSILIGGGGIKTYHSVNNIFSIDLTKGWTMQGYVISPPGLTASGSYYNLNRGDRAKVVAYELTTYNPLEAKPVEGAFNLSGAGREKTSYNDYPAYNVLTGNGSVLSGVVFSVEDGSYVTFHSELNSLDPTFIEALSTINFDPPDEIAYNEDAFFSVDLNESVYKFDTTSLPYSRLFIDYVGVENMCPSCVINIESDSELNNLLNSSQSCETSLDCAVVKTNNPTGCVEGGQPMTLENAGKIMENPSKYYTVYSRYQNKIACEDEGRSAVAAGCIANKCELIYAEHDSLSNVRKYYVLNESGKPKYVESKDIN